MTTFTGGSVFSQPFSYKPEDDPAFQDADTKALLSGAAQASLSRLAKPGGVWNQEDFSKITQHYMKPIQEQTKQRSEALQAFFRSRGWMDSGGAPEKQLKLFEAAERQAAENVYVPLTLEALRQRDTTAQADIAQAAGLGQQRLASYLQGRGQQFQEYSTGRQLEQTDQQLAVQLRGMAVQERSQLLNEANSAINRAVQQADATGQYVDPVTGQSYETLVAKRDKLARVMALAEQTGYVPTDIAREAGVPEGEVWGVKLGDFLTAEEIDALRGTALPAAGGVGSAGPTTLSPAQQSYVDSLAIYEPTPQEQQQIQALFLSGSPTALQDIQAITMTMYNRRLAALTGGGAPSASAETPPPVTPEGGGYTPPETQPYDYEPSYQPEPAAQPAAPSGPPIYERPSFDLGDLGIGGGGAFADPSVKNEIRAALANNFGISETAVPDQVIEDLYQGKTVSPETLNSVYSQEQAAAAQPAAPPPLGAQEASLMDRARRAAATADDLIRLEVALRRGDYGSSVELVNQIEARPKAATPPAATLPPAQRPSATYTDIAGFLEQARAIGATPAELGEMERLLRAGDVSGSLRLLSAIDERRRAPAQASTPTPTPQPSPTPTPAGGGTAPRSGLSKTKTKAGGRR